METIVSRCHPAIIFWMCKDVRAKGHVRARPQTFTVVANQIVHVDMNVDTGIR